MKIQYYTKSVWGNEFMYLVDSEAAQDILLLIGQKTISDSQILRFKRLGLVFERVFEPKKNN